MPLGILGKKLGMQEIFDAEGNRIPVTVVQAGPCFVTQIKSQENEGYTAVQVAYGTVREKGVNKCRKGHFAKAKITPQRHIREFLVNDEQLKTLQVGQVLGYEQFKPNDYIDATGISKGKGFAGVVKRYHMGGHPASHGTHVYHRHVGSIGCRFPQQVIKGKRMPGHMGTDRVTVQNLRLVEIRDGAKEGEKLLLIRGAVPGHRGAMICINPAVKA